MSVLAIGIGFLLQGERCVPAPGVNARDPDTVFLSQIERGFPAHADAAAQIFFGAVIFAGLGVHQNDVEGLKLIVDALEFGLHVVGLDDVAVGEMTEIELHPGAVEPVEGQLVDGLHPVPILVVGMVVPGRIDMGAVMGGQGDDLPGPALPVR